jgi:hypothetical protein
MSNLKNHKNIKNGYAKSRKQSKPSKLTAKFKLEGGKTLTGTCASFDDPKMPKTKLFFQTGQKRNNGKSKNFCIPCQIDIRVQGGKIAMIEEMNAFFKDIHEQALAEFPNWLEKWGCRADEQNPLLNLDEIREEWNFKKRQFGIFRLTAQAGFFTDSRPSNAKRLDIVEIELNRF